MGFFTTCINTTTTSSTLWNLYFYPLAPCFYFFLVPLMRLWAFQIDSDITLEVRLLVCLLGLLALRSTPAMSLFTGYKKTWKKKKKEGGKKMPPKQKPLFHCANNMLCSLHRIHPIFADLLILRWDKMTPWLHWQMRFSFHTRFYVTPGFTFLEITVLCLVLFKGPCKEVYRLSWKMFLELFNKEMRHTSLLWTCDYKKMWLTIKFPKFI